MIKVPFNRPTLVGQEIAFIRQAVELEHISGDGTFTRRCTEWLESRLDAPHAMLTQSCTAALEIAARLCDLRAGDEVIMPSYTFVSTANAVALCGATPVFVDIRSDTLNIDEQQVADAVTPRTRAIFAVHYAGVGCAMDAIMDVAARHGLVVVEDAAQALLARHRGRPLGRIGALAAFSFHETKNLTSGEGGALIVNDARFVSRAEILLHKGTDRSRFDRGEIDRYTWIDIGSSYLPSEITAAFLCAQFEHADEVLGTRMRQWRRYHAAFEEFEQQGLLRRPVVPQECEANAHIYYLLLPDRPVRDAMMTYLRGAGIEAPFHYVPLHSSPAGRRLGRPHGSLRVTESVAGRLLRLPLWHAMGAAQDLVIEAVRRFCRTQRPAAGSDPHDPGPHAP